METAAIFLGLFGWGLLLIIIAIITLIVQLKRRKLYLFIVHWNRWLGIIAFVLAIWGILAIFNLGGSFGQGIIGYPAPMVDTLRILALVILGGALIFPKVFLYPVFKSILKMFLKKKRAKEQMTRSKAEIIAMIDEASAEN